MFKGCLLGNFPRMKACPLNTWIWHTIEVSSKKTAKKFIERFCFVGSFFDFSVRKNVNSSFGFVHKPMGFCHDVGVTVQSLTQQRVLELSCKCCVTWLSMEAIVEYPTLSVHLSLQYGVLWCSKVINDILLNWLHRTYTKHFTWSALVLYLLENEEIIS